MSKYYPCIMEIPVIESVNIYYQCSREAYDKKDAVRVLEHQTSKKSRYGSVMLVKKEGPFGWFSKFPKYYHVCWLSNMLNKLNTREELAEFRNKSKPTSENMKHNDNEKD